MKRLFKIAVIPLIVSGCLSTAKLSDFPNSHADIPFKELKSKEYDKKSLMWTFDFKKGKDYNVLLTELNEEKTIEIIKEALDFYGYKIIESDSIENKVIGKRGLRSHEWKSMCVAYYNITTAETQVYIMNKVTQDITGGHQYNRAEEIGLAICEISEACKK